MPFLRFDLKFLFLIQVMTTYLLPKHMSQATVTNNCTSVVYATDACNKITYEQVYNILAKSENSFNITSALYPAKKPSSVRVFVYVYGPNEKNSTPASNYTWSISCLYAAVPAKVLQFWSLWSIMVTTRTQRLDITISLSCCDVTKGKLKQYIEDALAALQDLAVLPGLRDPQLNSAECIIEGNKLNISSTAEHSWRMKTMLVLSFLFSALSGPLLAFYATQKRDELSLIKKRTINFLCKFLFVTFIALVIAKEITVHTCSPDEELDPPCIDVKQPAIRVFEAIQPVLIGVGVFVFSVAYPLCKGKTDNQNNHSVGRTVEVKSFFFIICSNFAVFHFCWLLVGMMLNPIWGLVVLLLVCLVIGVITFAFYTFMSSITSKNNDGNITTDCRSWDCCQSFSSCLAGCLAVYGLIAMVLFAGQSYSGRDTANEALKEAVMYLISIFFSWLYWKKWVSKSHKSGDSQSRSVQTTPLLSQNRQAPENRFEMQPLTSHHGNGN
ncbi:hypothetical protein AWC38_SpisGene17137 [Stylophora pistillata]|uniref:MARVEL domain-containing protein n=2 Tax=Stylophora pistillata TaxID=50429 RepID=A0A2B4RQB5_STYPI|nr:hypothetical protein AWC38_SpisGene17137 [Stylophora pistillata]